jgi:hypothetical protein
MSWYWASLWNLRPYIIYCRNVAVWNLRSCIYWAPSLTRGRSAICSVITQSLRTRNNTLLSHLRLPQPGGPGSRIYIPQEQGGPAIPPGTGFPLRRLLRLSGLRWRCGWKDYVNWKKNVNLISTRGRVPLAPPCSRWQPKCILGLLDLEHAVICDFHIDKYWLVLIR